LIGLYEQLKLKQNEYVDLFNGLNDKLSYGDQTRLLGNIDAIKDVLFKYSDLIPENMVNLSDIHKIKLNNILERSVSPILVESAAEVDPKSVCKSAKNGQINITKMLGFNKNLIKFYTLKIFKNNVYQPIKVNVSLRNKFSFYERLILSRIKILLNKFKQFIEN